jgi:hypothetical protein
MHCARTTIRLSDEWGADFLRRAHFRKTFKLIFKSCKLLRLLMLVASTLTLVLVIHL